MKALHRSSRISGFTKTDLLIVLAAVALLLVLVPLWLRNASARASRINCFSQVKAVGLGFRLWANDHGEEFPMSVSTNKEGSMEYTNTGQVFLHYLVMSNELNTPKVLVCPNDKNRKQAAKWGKFSDQSLSYFVGLDASETNVNSILLGDRNIFGGTTLGGSVQLFTPNTLVGWTAQIHSKVGNIGLGDGSAQQVTVQGLCNQIQKIGSPFRLAIP